MLDDETDEAVEPTAEDTTADAEADAGADDAPEAAAPPDPPTGGADEEVLKAPEVPSDANEKISAAQAHINSLNMDEERDAAEKAAKQL